MDEYNNIIITGGRGLVGMAFEDTSNIIKVGREYNLTSAERADALFEDNPTANRVIHCAARVGGIGGNIASKGEYFYDNILINTNLIESARKYRINKLVAFLSTCIFPDNAHYPLSEKQIHNGEPHSSNYAYAYAKRMADIQIRAYREQYGLNFISVIPTNIYGPDDNFSLVEGHVLPMLIHKIYLANRMKKPLVVWGSGKPLREFIYSKDVAKLTLWALENYNEEEPIILSPSQEISIKDLVDILVELFNFKGKVIYDESKPDGQMRKPSDNSKLMSYLPDFQFTPIEKGIEETVNWFRENYDKARK